MKKEDWEAKSFEHSDRVVYLIEHKEYPIELYKDWGPGEWDVERLIKEADVIDGIPFVKLEAVLEWKKEIIEKKTSGM